MKYLNELNRKQTFIRFCKLTFIIILLVTGGKTSAQLSRLAIINLVDSNLIYKHIGYKIFPDKSDTFDCQFNCKKYINEELTRTLSSRFTVSLISIPNTLLSPNGSIYTLSEIKKEVKSWIASLKSQHDFVIFVEAGEQDDYMDPIKQKLKSSGLYTRGNPANSWAAVYSTTKFTLIRTSNLGIVDYGWSEMDYLLPLKEYQFPRENLLIDPEMLPIIKTGLVKLIDYKLEYFLTNSFLLTADDDNGFK